jgi:hypothetical protein
MRASGARFLLNPKEVGLAYGVTSKLVRPMS